MPRAGRILGLATALVGALLHTTTARELPPPASEGGRGRWLHQEGGDTPTRPALDVSEAPVPVFDDLEGRGFQGDDEVDAGGLDTSALNRDTEGAASKQLASLVEVYENEFRGFVGGWGWGWGALGSRSQQQTASTSIPRWSYKDGTRALAPAEILPPDDWEWISDWEIDHSGARDAYGWEYSKHPGKLDKSRVPRGQKLTDKYRRRRWVRAMRQQLKSPSVEDQAGRGGGLEAEAVVGAGAPALHAHAYEFESDDFTMDMSPYLGMEDVELGRVKTRDLGRGVAAAEGPAIGGLRDALVGVREWWAEEFTFRGFGIGLVKPVFKGVLLRPDLGLGIRLPLTHHFRSWERREGLPSVSSSFFTFWPPSIQCSVSFSYPAGSLQEWAATMLRMLALSSKGGPQPLERKETVQRLGLSVSIRYSALYGFQWWLAPYFFLLPGVGLLWRFYLAISSALAGIWRSAEAEHKRQKAYAEAHLRELRRHGEAWRQFWEDLREWALRKTSGLGYSLSYSGARLGGAIILNFQPFFLPILQSPLLPWRPAPSTPTSTSSPTYSREPGQGQGAPGTLEEEDDGSGYTVALVGQTQLEVGRDGGGDVELAFEEDQPLLGRPFEAAPPPLKERTSTSSGGGPGGPGAHPVPVGGNPQP